MINTKPRFAIGTQFIRRSKTRKDVETVVDIHTTTNFAGEVVKVRYVSTWDLMGQTMTDRDVVDTTVAMGLVDKSLLKTS